MKGIVLGNVFVDELLKVLRGEIFILFVVLALGYLLGRITIKGVSLGSSGVFIVALGAGILFHFVGEDMGVAIGGGITTTVKNLGLALFVTGVGFIAGPTFIRNFKKKAFSFITIGICAVVTGTVVVSIFMALDKSNLNLATGLGILMGGLSTTPGQGAAISLFADEALQGTVAAAAGLTYPFGVLGVVLFVQLMPKILRKDIGEEVKKLKALSEAGEKKQEITALENAVLEPVKPPKERFKLDSLGICAFSLAVVLGMLLGALTIPMGGAKFNLGITGGALIMGLLFGHFRRVGNVSLEVPKTTLNPIREIGLVLFLMGSGIEGGMKMFSAFNSTQMAILLAYGAVITISPLIVVFFVGRFAFKLDLLNNLGATTGGMTSTPALGALIHTAKTDDVAQSYAATYPISLFLLVLVPQILNWIF